MILYMFRANHWNSLSAKYAIFAHAASVRVAMFANVVLFSLIILSTAQYPSDAILPGPVSESSRPIIDFNCLTRSSYNIGKYKSLFANIFTASSVNSPFPKQALIPISFSFCNVAVGTDLGLNIKRVRADGFVSWSRSTNPCWKNATRQFWLGWHFHN